MSELLVEPFTLPAMQRALTIVVLLGLVGGIIGTHVVLRRLAFLTETLQHTVFPGIALAFAAGASIVLGAGIAAVITVALFTLLEHRKDVDRDGSLAILATLFLAFGVALVSRRSGYQHDLTALFFGRILTVSSSQVLQIALIAAVVCGAVLAAHRQLVLIAFDRVAAQALGYRVFALDLLLNLAIAGAVVAAVQAVGSVLVVAFVVTPAATARLFDVRPLAMMVVAAALHCFTGWLALGLAYRSSVDHGVDLAPAATVVLAFTAVFFVVWLARNLRPRRAAAVRFRAEQVSLP